MGRLLDRLVGERRWPEALTVGERWIAFGQKPESAYRALMITHAALGDMPKVAAAYERCVKSLKDSGFEPSQQTRELLQSLKSGKGTPSVKAVPPKSMAKEPASNIPIPLTSFIGRERELKEIARLLASSRLLTLTGPGGVGKTRLAIEAANGSLKKFKDGVFWIGMVGLADENLIPQEIAQSLNLREVSNEPLIETLKTFLKSKDILLVIDNCEHLIRACAQYAEQLLAACPKLKILATSIEALGLFNETTWQVPSLSLPARQGRISLSELQEFASIELFDERARKAKSGFALDEENASSVAKICQQLDGIPLAIELAAARIRVLSVDEIAARLDDRFSLLTAGSRTAIPRHQTLRATIDWSYELLTEPERALLRRLSVFAGGFTLEAAEEVCSQGMKRGEILGLLGRLVDKSLVIAEADSEVGGTRYRLLETIRQYALEKLMEIKASRVMRDQHLEFYTKLAERAAPNAFGVGSVRYSDLIDRELDNIRSAMEWSLETHQALLAFRLLAALFYFWYNRSPLSEWYTRFEGALSLPEGLERTVERAKAINSISFFYWAGMSDVNPLPDLEDALSIGREFGDAHVIAQSLLNLGRIQTTAGNYSNARSLLLESLDIWRSLGSEHNVDIIFAQIFLGEVAFHEGDLIEARTLYQESISALRAIQDQNFLAYTARHLAQVACRQADFAEAELLCRESLSLNQGLRDERGLIACISAIAAIALARERAVLASQLFGAVGALLGARNMRMLQIDQLEYERNVKILRSQLDEKALAKSWAKGSGLSLDEAIALALEET
jgi:predicted ATPase